MENKVEDVERVGLLAEGKNGAYRDLKAIGLTQKTKY